MHRRCCLLKHRRCIIPQLSAPEDGRFYRPKHVQLIGIHNKIIIVASSWLFILLTRQCCQILIEFEVSREVFEKNAGTKLHDSPRNASRTDACRQTERRTDRPDDATVAFRNFAKVPRTHFCTRQ